MGTETEALRWKQWIDRWMKISAPEAATTAVAANSNSLMNSASSGKIDAAAATARKSQLSPEQLQYQLINMVKEGDPVFCEGLSRELLNNVTYFRLVLKCLSGIEVSDRARPFFCQILFYLCKCPAPSVRKFLLSLVPVLLMNHGLLVDDSAHLEATEIALLALYQADLNYQPEPPSTRIPSLQSPTLFHAGFRATELFPFNVNPSLIQAPSELFPTVPVVNMTDYTRFIIYYRLCQSFQEFLPVVPEIALVMYGLFISRFVGGGCAGGAGDDLEDLESIFVKQIANATTVAAERGHTHSSSLSSVSSNTSLHPASVAAALRYLDAEDWRFMRRLIMPMISLKLRFPSNAEIYLLWADFVPFLWAKHLQLGDHLKRQLLVRSRVDLLPQVILALE